MISKLFGHLSLALLLGLSACGDAGHDPDRITLTIADRQRGLKTIADASGVFKDAPYKVVWSDFSTMPPLFEALDGGAVDLASSIDNLGIQAGIRGVAMKIVAAGHGSAANDALIVPAGSPIRSVADLKGRHVIVSTIRGGTADAVLIGALAEAGLSEQDVKIGYMGHADALAAFLSGKIDAWATNDPAFAQAENAGARLLRDGGGLRKATSYISASNASLKDPARRAAIGDFLARFSRARVWGNAHLDAYANAYSAATGIAPDLARKVIKRQAPVSLGPITPETIREAQALADDYARRGLFPAGVKVTPFFDPSVFTESRQSKP
jgi:sulfonate transport system substrate-binding protein